MEIRTLALITFLIGTSGCGTLEDDITPSNTEVKSDRTTGKSSYFEYYDDPSVADPTYELRFDALPLGAELPVRPWTDTYWPKHKGGIAYRWQTDESHNYSLIPYESALQLSEDQLRTLSPTEKYDLFVGNREYALTERTFSGNNASDSTWQGYCHGWTMASIHFDEPRPVVMTNPDGLRIPFGSSDVKALLTYFQGEVVTAQQYGETEVPYKKTIRSVGTTCTSDSPIDPSCTDPNPGAFHVIMANEIGLRGKAFGIDATATYEKWNQPVHTYQSSIVSRRPATVEGKPNIAEQIVIQTKFVYTAEIDPQWETTNNTPLHKDHEKTVSYRLSLNAQGEIIDGEWILLVEGGDYTISELYTYFLELDENQDGHPDLNEDQAAQGVWQNFDFPDYVWLQDGGEFAPEFEQAASKYTLMFNTLESRRALYRYLAKLASIYEASTN